MRARELNAAILYIDQPLLDYRRHGGNVSPAELVAE